MTLNETNVKSLLDKMRPVLQRDGGDVELIKIINNVVIVDMRGACSSCASIEETLKLGIESVIIEQIPEVVEVRQATDEELWGL